MQGPFPCAFAHIRHKKRKKQNKKAAVVKTFQNILVSNILVGFSRSYVNEEKQISFAACAGMCTHSCGKIHMCYACVYSFYFLMASNDIVLKRML
jgi:ethanolamine ammonia-lyase large subunit